jgi:hypothetical protein
MTPDAQRRFDVYREGQLAYRSGAQCPYTDWRYGTWAKGWKAAQEYVQSLETAPALPAETLDESIVKAARESIGFDGGLQTVNTTDLINFAHAVLRIGGRS